MRRPTGVIVSCIILGFGALILLMVSVGFLFLSTMMGHIPIPTPPGQPTPNPGVMSAAMVGIGIVFLIPTAWAAITVVGLARMKNWARYSIIIIGAGLVLFSLLGLLGTVASQAILATTQQSTGQDPAMLHVGMMINGMTFLAAIGVGIWWLIYFARRSTREAFTIAAPQAAPRPGFIPPPSPYAASSYEVASYIPAPDPAQPPVPSPVVMLDQSVAEQAAPPGRPLTITIIAILMLICLVFMIPYAFLPFPIFMFGVELAGWSGHLVMAAFAIASGLAGIGLWQMKKIGLYIAYAVYGLGVLSCATFLLPSVRVHMAAYQQDLMLKMPMATPQMAAFQNQMMTAILMPTMVFSVVFGFVLIILLFLNRAAFDRPTQAAA
jgi:hypothetical protein